MKLLFFIPFFVISSYSLNYSRDDLDILVAEKNFSEFFLHANDIRPTERSEHWKDNLLTMSEYFLKELQKKNQLELNELQILKNISNWPTLKGNEFFLAEKSRLGLHLLKQCFQKEQLKDPLLCANNVEKIFPPDEVSVEISSAYALELFLHFPQKMSTIWNYLKKAIQTEEIGEFVCKDKAVENIIQQQLNSLWNEFFKEQDFQKNTKNLLSKSCLTSLKKNWVASLFDLSSYSFEIRLTRYLILESRKLISREESDYFILTYFLESPIPGSLFNLSWTLLSNLKLHPEQRTKAIQFFKNLNLLPGKIFLLPQEDKRKVLMLTLAENFPEYIDLYANTCLDYRSGKRHFPHGNPTLACDELFLFAKDHAKNVLTPYQQELYSKNLIPQMK